MKLWSDNMAKQAKLPKLYATENINLEDKVVVAKFFCSSSNYTWYVIEGEKTKDGDWRFFGLVDGAYKEYGYFLLSQLTSLMRGSFLLVERDKYFSPTKVSEL
jgi:hypothetical protein